VVRWKTSSSIFSASAKQSPRQHLHEKDANGKVTPISNPLRRWRKKINDCRREAKNDLERPQLYICPLNVNANHFTLLEINEQTKMIYHYDSMASHGIIHRKTKSTPVRRVLEVRDLDSLFKDGADPPQAEFKDLCFGYSEAVSIHPNALPCAICHDHCTNGTSQYAP